MKTETALFPTYTTEQPKIRVMIKNGINKVTLTCNSSFKLYPYHTDENIGYGKALPLTEISLSKKGFEIKGKGTFPYPGLRFVPDNGEGMSVGDVAYYGDIILLRDKTTFKVINGLGLEQYLVGVLGSEMPISWPDEALKAQAVASRTYALYQMKTQANNAYHLENTVMSQVYAGRGSENIRANRIINETSGLIMTYNWKVFPAYFHSSSGGHTEDGAYVFDTFLAPLRGRPDPDTPDKPWDAEFTSSQIQAALEKPPLNLKDIGLITSVKALGQTPSGRIDRIRITHSRGEIEIRAADLRLALGPGKMKSTLFSLKSGPGKYQMQGTGWGHGVGMSQWGVLTKSKKAVDYRQILRYYYPGVHLLRIYKQPGRST